jgi:hypothetical protein
MRGLSAAAALQLPVRLRGIELGRPVDLVLETGGWQVLGFVVRCRDKSRRFLPYAAAQLADDEIAVRSALLLLEEVGFYQSRGVSYRSLLGGEVERGGRAAGSLRDIVVGGRGAVTELVLEHRGELRRVPTAGSTVVPTRASAA